MSDLGLCLPLEVSATQGLPGGRGAAEGVVAREGAVFEKERAEVTVVPTEEME